MIRFGRDVAEHKKRQGRFDSLPFLVRFSMNKPPAMLVVGVKSFSFK